MVTVTQPHPKKDGRRATEEKRAETRKLKVLYFLDMTSTLCSVTTRNCIWCTCGELGYYSVSIAKWCTRLVNAEAERKPKTRKRRTKCCLYHAAWLVGRNGSLTWIPL